MTVQSKIQHAFRRFMVKERRLLEASTNERSLTHRFAVQIERLLAKARDEVRWGDCEERLKPILRRAGGSTNAVTSKLTEEVQEALLRRGCFEYLNLEEQSDSAQTAAFQTA